MSSDPKFYNDANKLAKIFGVSRREFHKKIKDVIIDSCPEYLKGLKIENPDIGIGKDNSIWLAVPGNHKKQVKTDLTIDMFTEEPNEQND